jgi:AraC family transcriptional regulator
MAPLVRKIEDRSSMRGILPAETPKRLNEGADVRIAGIGRVLLWSGGSLWIGHSAGRAQAHAHHAIQISLALSGTLRLLDDDSGDWAEYTGAMVLPHRRHQFDGSGETVAQIFVEPETSLGRALLEKYSGPSINALPADTIEPLIGPLRAAYFAAADNAALIAASQRLLILLCGSEQSSLSVDPRITRSIAFVRSRLSTSVSLAQAAAVAHLSPSRFRHLFVAQTGVSFRAYVLWARVGSAVSAAMGGLSWTDAALSAGFADSAHLSRTCRRMFGIAPTMLIREGDRR